MDQQQSQWQTQALSETYLEGVRGAIPLAETQIEIMLRVVQAWVPDLRTVLDLGCGDGILGHAVLDRYPAAHAVLLDFSESMLQAACEKLGGRLALVERQCGWLREIGCQDVDCFFKVFELAMFGGRKPG